MKKLSNFLKGLLLPIVFLFFWQIMSGRIENPIVLPSIDSVVKILVTPTKDLLSIGSLLGNTIISLVRVLLSYITAIIIAVPLGMFLGYSEKAKIYISPFINIFRPIAPLAWVPLVLAWFGISSIGSLIEPQNAQIYSYLNNIKFSMLFIIFIGAFFPILTNTAFGVSSVRNILIDSAKTLGAGKTDIFIKVLFKASLPSIVTGFKTGLGVAWMCLVSAEMLPGSLAGLGYLITHAYTIARTDVVIAGIVVISIIGAFIDSIFNFVENKYFKWQRGER